jgi:hypothetical protein
MSSSKLPVIFGSGAVRSHIQERARGIPADAADSVSVAAVLGREVLVVQQRLRAKR